MKENQPLFVWLEVSPRLTGRAWQEELQARVDVSADQLWAANATPISKAADMYLIELVPLMDQEYGVNLQFTSPVVAGFQSIATEMADRSDEEQQRRILTALAPWGLHHIWGAWPGGLTLGIPSSLLSEAKSRIQELFEAQELSVEVAHDEPGV